MSSPRRLVEGVSVHGIQRGNNRCAIFADDADREAFLLVLAAISRRRKLDLHSYVLMDTHFHLLATPQSKTAFSQTMQDVGSRYVRYFNRRHDRIGTLWSHRPRSNPIKDERHWFMCLRYIEQNPVRAKMVTSPGDYRWSSYAANAMGARCDWLTQHPLFTALGSNDSARQAAYRAMCAELLGTADLVALRHPVALQVDSEPARR
jgi:putative transposase